MNKLLVIVDMQKDFIDGALGSEQAQLIVPNVVNKIAEWDGDIVCTFDTHYEDYLETNEGHYLPVEHCIYNSEGWKLDPSIAEEIISKQFDNIKTNFVKNTFGSIQLANFAKDYDEICLVGLCTDICVVTNALLIKTYCPEAKVVVDSNCCAGVTPETHKAALITMKSCQIEVE